MCDCRIVLFNRWMFHRFDSLQSCGDPSAFLPVPLQLLAVLLPMFLWRIFSLASCSTAAMFGVWDEKPLHHQQSWMVIVRFTKAAAGEHKTHSSQWFTLGAQTKAQKTQIEAPKEKHHSNLRDSSGIVLSVKDAINHPISRAPADLIYMFTQKHQSSQTCRSVPKKLRGKVYLTWPATFT